MSTYVLSVEEEVSTYLLSLEGEVSTYMLSVEEEVSTYMLSVEEEVSTYMLSVKEEVSTYMTVTFFAFSVGETLLHVHLPRVQSCIVGVVIARRTYVAANYVYVFICL